MPQNFRRWLGLTVAVVGLIATSVRGDAGTLKLGEIVRLKGQETNVLQGLGLVVGLSGTGDGDALPTARSLARMMQLMGGPISGTQTGSLNLADVGDAKNVALVFVTATIPQVGAQAGDAIDVSVHAINAKSLQGGTLMLTPMLGPRPDTPIVYAMAQGKLQTSLDSPVTTATIRGGAKMEASVAASYVKDQKITLILNKSFASFDTAHRVEVEINELSAMTLGRGNGSTSLGGGGAAGLGGGGVSDANRSGGYGGEPIARAIDQLHIEVAIPPAYQNSPIEWIWYLMTIPIRLSDHHSRVVINQREGVVVIGRDVEIAPGLISHRNLRIEAGGVSLIPIGDGVGIGGVGIGAGGINGDPSDGGAKLKNLADALNALNVSTDDLIAIIKTLQRKGDLFGEVIYE